jgi:hypothetical protein
VNATCDWDAKAELPRHLFIIYASASDREQQPDILLTMFDFVIQMILEFLLEGCWTFILWPVVLIVCTPFILVRAVVVMAMDKARFFPSIADGYTSVSDYWKR